MGRPSTYTEIVGDSICEQMAIGRSILSIAQDPDYPAESTIYHWLSVHPSFAEKYARARELQAEHYAAEIIDLSDRPVEGRKVVIKADGSEEVTIGDTVERTRLQIDARKWYASKVAPKRWGDRVQTEISGPNGGPIEVTAVREMSIEQIDARLAELKRLKGE